MDSVQEAYDLCESIRKALGALSEKKYQESEVQFRLDTLRGILIIASNDAHKMLERWKEE